MQITKETIIGDILDADFNVVSAAPLQEASQLRMLAQFTVQIPMLLCRSSMLILPKRLNFDTVVGVSVIRHA